MEVEQVEQDATMVKLQVMTVVLDCYLTFQVQQRFMLAVVVDFVEILQDTHHLRVRVIRYQAAAVEVVQEAAVAAAMLMLMAWRAALIQVVVAVVAGREQAVTAGLE